MIRRVSFYIDGFNLYHSLKENAPDCRWLSLRKMCESFLSDDETIENIYYFSALATWHPDQGKISRHKLYISKLREEGVIPVLGKFKVKNLKCHSCGTYYTSHEEKETDVNIALRIVADAVCDRYDTAILVSGDTDMIPAFRTVRELCSGKKLGVAFPLCRYNAELDHAADDHTEASSRIIAGHGRCPTGMDSMTVTRPAPLSSS